MSHDMNDSLARGREGAKAVFSAAKGWGFSVEEMPEAGRRDKAGVDAYFVDEDNARESVQVKTCFRSKETGNFAYETVSSVETGAPGWGVKCEARFLLYWVHGTKEILCFETRALREAIDDWSRYPLRDVCNTNYCGESWTTQIRLVPMGEARRLACSTFRMPISEIGETPPEQPQFPPSSTLELRALDFETYRIGPGSVAPKAICFSEGWTGPGGHVETSLMSLDDPGAKERIVELLQVGRYRLVTHNGAFDLSVICATWPDLVPLVWAKVDAQEVSDTMIREMMLNLSTVGKIDKMFLPDGSTRNLAYSMGDLVLHHFGEDLSEDKKADDAWRLHFDKLVGLRADQYPAEASNYAQMDAFWTLQLYFHQEGRTEGPRGHASCALETFHAAAAFALYQITVAGMVTDSDEYRKARATIEGELAPARMTPLVESGLMIPAQPPIPYKKKAAEAEALVAGWLGIAPEDVDWGRVDDNLCQAVQDSGIKFKKPETETIPQAPLRHRILALHAVKAGHFGLEEALGLEDDVLLEILGDSVPLTPKGAVQTGKVIVKDLAPLDRPLSGHDEAPLACFKRKQDLKKVVEMLDRIRWEGKLAGTVHFPFSILKATGRSSSRQSDLFPSCNGQNVDPRCRPMFRARPGFVLCSADYSTLELACVAQVTYDLFGHSVHRDKIMAGYDLHAFLGAQLARHLNPEFGDLVRGLDADEAYREFKALEKGDDEAQAFYARWRKLAKPIGLGFPGGLGVAKIVDLAKASYDVDMVAMAEEDFATNPDPYDAVRESYSLLYHARRLYGWQDSKLDWTPELLGMALGKKLRDLWLQTYLEMDEFFSWLRSQALENEPDMQNRSLKDRPLHVLHDGTEFTDEELQDRLSKRPYSYHTPLGMFRAACTYTEAANGQTMQSPAAEGFKAAEFDVVRACLDPTFGSVLYGNARVLNQVHDELISEMAEGPDLQDLVREKKRLMEEGMARVITDVPIKAELALMRNWRKEAKPVFDAAGNLLVWEPKA